MLVLMKRSNGCFYRFLRRSVAQRNNTGGQTYIQLDNPTSYTQVLKELLLKRQELGNGARVENLQKSLEMNKYGVTLRDKAEIIKCFYPTKYSTLRVDQDRSYSNEHLEIEGRGLLHLVVKETFMQLYKRTSKDVGKYDFNYGLKMGRLSSWKKKPALLVRHFLKRKGLAKLARLPIPQSQIPLRIQYVYDQRSFNAIIGYIAKTNDAQTVNEFLKAEIAKDIVQTMLTR